jgi:hypothetical protein
MFDSNVDQLSSIFSRIADELDIPEALRDEMIAKYDDLCEWLKGDNKARYDTDSDVYPQGSVRLGTVVKPIDEAGEYDVDLVYLRRRSKSGITQEELVEQEGQQLSDYIADRKRRNLDVPTLIRKRRCWSLDYEGQFHMDVLPAIPDESPQGWVRSPETAILLTDRKLHAWQPSNPKAYAEWFRSREWVVFNARREIMAKSANVDVESIPEEQVRTPLTIAVQLLKRHRDIRYTGDPDDKPISIIVTTLAAAAYANESTVLDTMAVIAENMGAGIVKKGSDFWIPNPVNANENFADKWNEFPQRAARFFEWLNQFRTDLKAAREASGLHRVGETLSPAFGKDIVSRAFENVGAEHDKAHLTGNLKVDPKTGQVGTAGMKVPQTTWYGEKEEK